MFLGSSDWESRQMMTNLIPLSSLWLTLAGYKVGVCQTNFFWHVSNPRPLIQSEIRAADDVIFVYCHRCWVDIALFLQRKLTIFLCALLPYPHSLEVSFLVFSIQDSSNVDMNGRAAVPWLKCRILSHVRLLMLRFDEMISLAGCNPFTVYANTAQGRILPSRLQWPCESSNANKVEERQPNWSEIHH